MARRPEETQETALATQEQAKEQAQKRVQVQTNTENGQRSTLRGTAQSSLRAQKKAATRKLILDTAQQLINEQGYTDTKMRDVASAASMSYQTLYKYFPTKGLILQELLTRDLIKIQRATFNTLQGSANTYEKLRELSKSYVDAIRPEDRDLWREVCAELLKVTSRYTCLLDLLDNQAFGKFEKALITGQQQNQLESGVDTKIMAGVLFSLLDSTLMRYLVNAYLSQANMVKELSTQLRFCITPFLR